MFAHPPTACYALNGCTGTTESSRGLRDMDDFLDNLFGGLKTLEGRFIPKGWSAAIVAGSVLCFAGLLLVIAFLMI